MIWSLELGDAKIQVAAEKIYSKDTYARRDMHSVSTRSTHFWIDYCILLFLKKLFSGFQTHFSTEFKFRKRRRRRSWWKAEGNFEPIRMQRHKIQIKKSNAQCIDGCRSFFILHTGWRECGGRGSNNASTYLCFTNVRATRVLLPNDARVNCINCFACTQWSNGSGWYAYVNNKHCVRVAHAILNIGKRGECKQTDEIVYLSLNVSEV